MLTVIDSGLGNINSFASIISRVGGQGEVVRDPAELATAHKIILPGVGAFDYGMSRLRDGGWIDALNEAVLVRRVPVLGVCLGMQLMCKSSEEGQLPGLGWMDAEVERFKFPADSSLKIPHMGWNTVEITKPNPLIEVALGREARFYFVHSYHVVCKQWEDVFATTSHGYRVTAAFCRGNVFGVQFHPEKSHRFGMELISRFIELQCSNIA